MSPPDSMYVPANWHAPRVTWPVTSEVGAGLAGAAATASRVAWLDPAGRLSLRGEPLDTLAGSARFEEVAFLVVTGARPAAAPEASTRFTEILAAAMHTTDRVRARLARLAPGATPLERLRAGVSSLEIAGDDAPVGPAARLIGGAAALLVLAAGDPPGRASDPPAPGDGIAGAILRAISAERATAPARAALDTALVAYADDGLSPQAFTTLVVGSCLASRTSALVAGLGAAGGGHAAGAAGAIAEALDTLEDERNAARWVDEHLATGGPLPGFGHRIFGARDPRVACLRSAAETLAEHGGMLPPAATERRLRLAQAIEAHGVRRLADRGIGPNAHLYGALLLTLLGAGARLVPAIVAFAGLAGTLARLEEHLSQNRIFRPLDRYVGPAPRPFVEVERR